MPRKKSDPITCQFVVERNETGEVRRCGAEIQRHELPQDPYWRHPSRLMCSEHLRTYTAPIDAVR